MRDEYRRQLTDRELTLRSPETDGALHYVDRELISAFPSDEAEQWALLESLMPTIETAGDACVLTALCREHTVDLVDHFDRVPSADFLGHIGDAVRGAPDYLAFIAERGYPNLNPDADPPSWADFCAWVLYALARTRPGGRPPG